MEGRHVVYQAMAPELYEAINNMDRIPRVGECNLICGDFCADEHWAYCTGATRVLVNNFNEIFGARGVKAGEKCLDDRVAAIFAAMKPGGRMLTLEPLRALGPSRDEANGLRKRRGLAESDDASYFSYRKTASTSSRSAASHVRGREPRTLAGTRR